MKNSKLLKRILEEFNWTTEFVEKELAGHDCEGEDCVKCREIKSIINREYEQGQY